jgi:Coenzyme PQQ synthesis protein D (PqqD)
MSIPGTCYYLISEKDIAHEIIDGEAIIIHFDTGNYYSLNGMAAVVWEWISARATYGEIVGAFQSVTPEDIAEINGFVEGLVKEGILERTGAALPSDRRAESLPPKGTLVFAAPRFNKYNDMQHLLLSDPIHEVDETGWPHPQPHAKG